MHVGLKYRHPGIVHSVEETGEPVPDREYGENIPAVTSRCVVIGGGNSQWNIISPDQGWHLEHQVGGEDPEGHHHGHLGVVGAVLRTLRGSHDT